MAKKFIIIKSATPVEYRIVSEQPKPEPKPTTQQPGGQARDVLALQLESEGDITVSKVSLVIEEA